MVTSGFDKAAPGRGEPSGSTLAEAALARESAQLHARARELEEDTRALRRDREPHRPMSRIRIGLLLPAAAEMTAPILAAFHGRWPTLRLTIEDISSVGGERALLSGDVDAAFLWTPVTWERLRVQALFDDRVVALLNRDHPLASRTLVTVDQLADERFTVSRTMTDRWRDASTLRPWREQPEHALEVDGPRSALDAIAAGLAASVGPASLSRVDPHPGIRPVALDVRGGPTAVLCARLSDGRSEVANLLATGKAVADRMRHVAARRRRASLLPAPSSTTARQLVGDSVTDQAALTARERDVLERLGLGWSAQAIATSLGISPSTVRKHLEHVYSKLECNDRLSAVNRARGWRLID